MKLEPGDILLFRVVSTSPVHDKLIAFMEKCLNKQFTRASYCHAALIDTDTDLMLEAVWPKTHIIPIKSRNNEIEVYRVKNVTHEQKLQAVKWAHQNLGVWYSIGQLFFGLFPSKHKLICSVYVAKAWESAGIKLGDLSEKVFSPDEIAVSSKLELKGTLSGF